MKIRTIVISAVLVVGAGAAVSFFVRRQAESNVITVEVVPVTSVNSASYGVTDSGTVSGTIISRDTQVVSLDTGHELIGVYVEAGDRVKRGDKLLEYDMLGDELKAEMEELTKLGLELRLEAQKKDLATLKSGRVPTASADEDDDDSDFTVSTRDDDDDEEDSSVLRTSTGGRTTGSVTRQGTGKIGAPDPFGVPLAGLYSLSGAGTASSSGAGSASVSGPASSSGAGSASGNSDSSLSRTLAGAGSDSSAHSLSGFRGGFLSGSSKGSGSAKGSGSSNGSGSFPGSSAGPYARVTVTLPGSDGQTPVYLEAITVYPESLREQVTGSGILPESGSSDPEDEMVADSAGNAADDDAAKDHTAQTDPAEDGTGKVFVEDWFYLELFRNGLVNEEGHPVEDLYHEDGTINPASLPEDLRKALYQGVFSSEEEGGLTDVGQTDPVSRPADAIPAAGDASDSGSSSSQASPAALAGQFQDTAPAALAGQFQDTAPAALAGQFQDTAPAALAGQLKDTAPADDDQVVEDQDDQDDTKTDRSAEPSAQASDTVPGGTGSQNSQNSGLVDDGEDAKTGPGAASGGQLPNTLPDPDPASGDDQVVDQDGKDIIEGTDQDKENENAAADLAALAGQIGETGQTGQKRNLNLINTGAGLLSGKPVLSVTPAPSATSGQPGGDELIENEEGEDRKEGEGGDHGELIEEKKPDSLIEEKKPDGLIEEKKSGEDLEKEVEQEEEKKEEEEQGKGQKGEGEQNKGQKDEGEQDQEPAEIEEKKDNEDTAKNNEESKEPDTAKRFVLSNSLMGKPVLVVDEKDADENQNPEINPVQGLSGLPSGSEDGNVEPANSGDTSGQAVITQDEQVPDQENGQEYGVVSSPETNNQEPQNIESNHDQEDDTPVPAGSPFEGDPTDDVIFDGIPYENSITDTNPYQTIPDAITYNTTVSPTVDNTNSSYPAGYFNSAPVELETNFLGERYIDEDEENTPVEDIVASVNAFLTEVNNISLAIGDNWNAVAGQMPAIDAAMQKFKETFGEAYQFEKIDLFGDTTMVTAYDIRQDISSVVGSATASILQEAFDKLCVYHFINTMLTLNPGMTPTSVMDPAWATANEAALRSAIAEYASLPNSVLIYNPVTGKTEFSSEFGILNTGIFSGEPIVDFLQNVLVPVNYNYVVGEPEAPVETVSTEGEMLPDDYDDDSGSGYTAEELQEMILEQEKAIKETELQIREAELAIKEYKKILDGRIVYATINGIVKSAGGVDSSAGSNAFIVITGKEGLYVKGSVNELALDTIKVGDVITGTSYETGSTFAAEIVEISEYPDTGSNYYYGYGDGNSNSSFYPFLAYIENADGLSVDSYVDLSLDKSPVSASGDIYSGGLTLDEYMIRTDSSGRSFCYVRGKDGLLEKRYLEVGANNWGVITIKSGLAQNDYIAFPYGKGVEEGAKTVEVDYLTAVDGVSY